MSDDMFDDPGTAPVAKFPTMNQIGTDGPKLKCVYGKGTDQEQVKDAAGRLVIVKPVKLEHNVPSNIPGNKPGDRMSADFVILDGPPITEVLDKDGETTYTFPEPLVPGVSAELKAMYTNHTVLMGQLKPLMVNGENAPGKMTYGRIYKLNPKSAGGNKPWCLGRAQDEKQDAKDRAAAAAWVKAHPEPDLFG